MFFQQKLKYVLVYVGAQVIKIVIIYLTEHCFKIDLNAILIIVNWYLKYSILVMGYRKMYMQVQVCSQNAISG